MAILIEDAQFTTSGIALNLSAVYVDVMVVFPHGTGNAQARLIPFPYQEGQKGSTQLAQVDGVHNYEFSPIALVKNDFWHDINAGNAHDYVISEMQKEKPEWIGKIIKVIPTMP